MRRRVLFRIILFAIVIRVRSMIRTLILQASDSRLLLLLLLILITYRISLLFFFLFLSRLTFWLDLLLVVCSTTPSPLLLFLFPLLLLSSLTQILLLPLKHFFTFGSLFTDHFADLLGIHRVIILFLSIVVVVFGLVDLLLATTLPIIDLVFNSPLWLILRVHFVLVSFVY